MTAIDIVILVFVGIGAIWGLTRGFVRQLSSLVGLVVGLLVARALFSEMGEWIAPNIGVSVTVARVLAFFMIWIVVPLLFSLLASFLSKALQLIHLGWLNRLLGGALGTVKMMLLVGLVVQLLEFVDKEKELVPQTTIEQSMLYEPMKDFVGVFIPAVKSVGEHIVGQSQKK